MKLKIVENGPIILDTDGPVAVQNSGAEAEQRGPLFLCRCGQSANKPFCDGTHRKVKFEGGAAELSVS